MCIQPKLTKIRSQFSYAQAYFSTEPPQPLEDARLSQPHEDEERRRCAFAQAGEGP
jgi:hypothetical protein